MSGGSDNSGGDGKDPNDLLSQLFDLEEDLSKDEKQKKDQKDRESQEKDGAFTEGTDVLNSSPKSTEMAFGSSDEKDSADQPLPEDHTEFLNQASKQEDPDNVSLDAFLGVNTYGGGEQESQPLEDSDKTVIEEEALSDDAAGFFSDQLQDAQAAEKEGGGEDATAAEGSSENPFDEKSKKNQTIVLDDMVEAGSEQPKQEESSPKVSKSADPIDEALAEFSSEGASDEAKSQEPSSEGEEKIEEVFSKDEAGPEGFSNEEVSADDFSSVFEGGPIQVRSEPSKTKTFLSGKGKKYIGIAAAVLVFVGGFGFFITELQSREGLFGYRLEGFALQPAYQPPDEEARRRFANIISEADEARREDDPEQLQASLGSLRSIVDQDERNFSAASRLLEHLGLLMVWKGVSGELPTKFHALRKEIDEMSGLIERELNWSRVYRAEAWRQLALGETEEAYQKFRENLSTVPSSRDANEALLAELAYHKGDHEQALSILEDREALEANRPKFLKALLKNNHNELMQLASNEYWPAVLEVELGEIEGEKEAREALAKSEDLLQEIEEYSLLARRLREHRGDLYEVLEQNEKAREEWHEVVEQSPSLVRVWKKLAASYESDSHWDKALDAYRSALEAGDQSKELYRNYAQLLRMRMEVVDALSLLEEAIEKYPDEPRFYFEQGEAQLAVLQHSAAKESFEQALEVSPQYEPAILSLATIARKREEWERAEELYSKIDQNSERYAEALFGQGKLALARHQRNEAQRRFARAVSHDETYTEAYDQLIRLLLKQEEDRKAMAIVERALELQPDSPDLKMAKARIYQFRSKYDQALELIDPLIDSYDHLEELLLLQANVLIDKGDFKKAHEVLDAIEARELRRAERSYLRAKAYFYNDGSSGDQPVIGSNEAASRQIRRALRSDPYHEDYLNLHAEIAISLGQRVEAVEIIDKVLEQYPNSARAYSLRGELYLKGSDYEAAIESFEEARRRTRFRGDIYRKLAEAYRGAGDTLEAIRYYQKVSEWYPRDSSVFHELGKLYIQQSEYRQARRSFEQAIALNPKLADAHYHLGFLQKDLGNESQAIENFERYLSLDPNGVTASTVEEELYFLRQGQQN